jgi:hypothetical protein
MPNALRLTHSLENRTWKDPEESHSSIYHTYICSISYPSLPCKHTCLPPKCVHIQGQTSSYPVSILLQYYSRTASELRLLVCKEGRPLSELPLAVYVVAPKAAAHRRRRREAHGGQSESKRERGREAAAALLGTTKSIESRRDFPHFISAWPPPAFR